MTNIDTKAKLFNDYFVKQCCEITTESTLPSFLPRSALRLQNLLIDREKVLRIIRALDSKKAHGCDDISISMIKMCDTSIVEPLCLIFEKCLETGVYPSIWKKLMLYLCTKRTADKIRKTIALSRFCQYLAKYLKN